MERDFIIGVVGDFSGAGASRPERFVDVDRDEFAGVFERLAPTLARSASPRRFANGLAASWSGAR